MRAAEFKSGRTEPELERAALLKSLETFEEQQLVSRLEIQGPVEEVY